MMVRGLVAGVVACVVAMTEKPAMATEIQHVVSPNGIEAWLVEERAIPIISIQIGFRGGASRESAEQSGLATLFAGMLEEGAGPYDAAGFAEKVEEVAARFSFSADRDAVRVGASMLAERRDESLALLRLALTEPRFDAEPLTRVKAQMVSGIRQAETDPDRISAKAWFAAAYPDDAYGRSTRGALESVEGLTAEDLQSAQSILLNRSTMKIGVVGAISAEELGPILDELLGGLANEPLPALPSPEFAADPGVEVVAFDAPQSVVIFGHEGLARDDEDFIPAYVMNYVLGGGGFASRLTQEVREKRGLAYGVYSYLSPLDRAALYLGGVATANERVAESIDVIKAEWTRLAENGLSEEELDKAKRYLTGAFPLRFDSNGKIASFLVNAQLDDLGIDYIDKRNGLVEAVTVADIKRVAKRALRADELFFVVVGKPEGLPSN
ncbi:MAG: insulinase family protein [Rhodobacteraceae bacterium]|nr:insulinase family protein [Paracoccaceae bacterium]